MAEGAQPVTVLFQPDIFDDDTVVVIDLTAAP